MKSFYLRQKILALRDRYNVYDSNNNLAYHCKEKFISITDKLYLYCEQSKDTYLVRKKILSFLPQYQLFKNDECLATVRKRFTIFKQSLIVDSSLGEMEITGDFFAYDFNITFNNNVACSVHKKWFSFTDCYEINIYDETNCDFYIALIVLIDNCLHNNNNSQNNN